MTMINLHVNIILSLQDFLRLKNLLKVNLTSSSLLLLMLVFLMLNSQRKLSWQLMELRS